MFVGLERFNEVTDRRRRAKGRSEFVRRHGLMVSRVDVERRTAGRRRELGARVDRDVVVESDRVEVLGLVMVHVQNEPAAEGDVDQLESAANTQDRNVPPQGGVDGIKLQLVSLEIGFLGQMLRVGLAIASRCDIRPAREAETIHIGRNPVTGLHHDHLGPRAFQSGDVIRTRRECAR